MQSIIVVLPDGAKKELPNNSNAIDLANAISNSLAKKVVGAKVNGSLWDVRDALPDTAQVELILTDSPAGLDIIRHGCEHIMAAAICRLFKGAQVTMGPRNHDEGFYYDVDIGRAVTPDDLVAIEKEMEKIIAQKVVFSKSLVSKAEAKATFDKLGQRYKPEILEWIPDDQVSIYESGGFVDLCRGPHIPHTGFIKAFKLLTNSGCYWRSDPQREMLQRIYGNAFKSKEDLDAYLVRMEEIKKRDHRKIGPNLGLFFVSERFDSHEYSADRDVEVLITGWISQANQWVQKNILEAVAGVFAPRTVKLSTCALRHQDAQHDCDWEIDVKVFSSAPSAEQNKALRQLEADFSSAKGRFKLTVETRFVEEIGPGLVSWLPKGARVRNLIEDFSRRMHLENGYELVCSPHIAKSDLWKVSGHWDFYRESMFPSLAVDGQEYALKPMNCPFHVMMFKHKMRSYRDLPLRFFELGTVYRYELAGVMHGLLRVRGFTQDDAHLFCQWSEIDKEIDQVIGFVLMMVKTFGFHQFELNLSTRPKEFVGEIAQWDRAEAALENAIKRHGLPYVVDVGGGAFYGPKIDIKLRDSLDRMWQCSTVQLDFNLPQRFNMSFINAQGKPEQPVMLHRALFGSIERFLGILIEEHAGAFPMWLAPEQIRVLAIAERHLDFAVQLAKRLRQQGLRAEAPLSQEKLGAKIREAQLDKIPLMLVVGDEELQKGGATVRMRNGESKGFMPEAELIQFCLEESKIPIASEGLAVH